MTKVSNFAKFSDQSDHSPNLRWKHPNVRERERERPKRFTPCKILERSLFSLEFSNHPFPLRVYRCLPSSRPPSTIPPTFHRLTLDPLSPSVVILAPFCGELCWQCPDLEIFPPCFCFTSYVIVDQPQFSPDLLPKSFFSSTHYPITTHLSLPPTSMMVLMTTCVKCESLI